MESTEKIRINDAEMAAVNAEIADRRIKRRKRAIVRRIIIALIVLFLAVNYRATFSLISNAFEFVTFQAHTFNKLCDSIYADILARKTEIEVDAKVGSLMLQRLAHEFYGAHPELFYIQIGYSDFQKPFKIYVTYLYTADEVEEMTLEYNSMIDAIVSETDGMTDIEKVKYFHDYLVTNCTYTEGFYDAYTMLKYKKGVCMAYSLTMKALLDRCGIRNETVWTTYNNHEWNIVRLGLFWYHVDATWDDSDTAAAVSYKYFLVTDNEVRGAGHTQWINSGAYTHACYIPFYMNKYN